MEDHDVTRNGQSHFIVDAHVHLWDARPQDQRNVHGKQFSDCFYNYAANAPESGKLGYDEFLYPGGERLMKDFADGAERRCGSHRGPCAGNWRTDAVSPS